MHEEAKLSQHMKGRVLDWDAVFNSVEAAALRGYAAATYDLGMFYFKGTPLLPHDHERALAVLRLASQQVRKGGLRGLLR